MNNTVVACIFVSLLPVFWMMRMIWKTVTSKKKNRNEKLGKSYSGLVQPIDFKIDEGLEVASIAKDSGAVDYIEEHKEKFSRILRVRAHSSLPDWKWDFSPVEVFDFFYSKLNLEFVKHEMDTIQDYAHENKIPMDHIIILMAVMLKDAYLSPPKEEGV